MRAPAVIAAAIVASSLAAGAARARPALLDADAAAVVRIDPPVLFELASLLQDAGGEPGAVIGLVRAGARFRLGHDLLAKNGYAGAGFDPGSPIWIQLAAIDDERAEKVYQRLIRARDWPASLLRRSDKVMWRARAVLGLKNRRRAQKALFSALSLAVPGLVEVSASEHERVALMIGARPRMGRAVVRRLRRDGVVAMGWLDGVDAFVLLRMRRRVATVELVSSFAGVPVVWRRDRRKLLGALPPLTRRRGGWSGRLGGGAARTLRRPGAHLWIHARRLGEIVTLLDRTASLRRAASQLPRKRPGTPEPLCPDLATLASRRTITDVALSLERPPGSRQLRIAARFGLRDTRWLEAILRPTRPPIQHGAGGAVASGTLYTHDLRALAALRLPPALERGFSPGLRELGQCPGFSLGALMLTSWPELAASFLADLVRTEPRTRSVLSHFGPVTGAIRRPALDKSVAVAAATAGLDRAALEHARALFDLTFGRRRQLGAATVWGRGPIVAMIRRQRAGFAVGERSLRWFSKLPRGVGSPGPRAVVRGRIDVPAAVIPLAREVSALEPLARLARKRLGAATLAIDTEPHGLAAVLEVEVVK